MKVLFLPTNNHGVNFWRMKQYCDKMREKGVDSLIYGYDPKDYSGTQGWMPKFFNGDKIVRDNVYQFIQHADVSIYGYTVVPESLALIDMMQDVCKAKILVEIDDEVIDTPSYNPAFKLGMKPGSSAEKIVIEQMRIATGVVTSTEFLMNQYKRFNKRINFIPNCIDFTRWKVKNKKSKKLKVGWIGGGNHYQDLMIMKEVVPAIVDKYDVEFHFAGGAPEYVKNLKGVSYDTDWVDIDAYPKHMASRGFDIGLAPLDFNKFNHAKSNLRWLEYSSLKIPCVATKIEPYERSIENGKTGFLCETPDDWIKSVSTLIENESLRKTIGENAYQDVHDNWNLDTVTDKYIKWLKEVR